MENKRVEKIMNAILVSLLLLYLLNYIRIKKKTSPLQEIEVTCTTNSSTITW